MRNTHVRYGTVASALHWIMALLIVAAVLTIEFSELFANHNEGHNVATSINQADAEESNDHHGPRHMGLLNAHAIVGMSLGVLAILRLLWRLNNPRPAPPVTTQAMISASRLTHRMLYFLMLTIPLSGWIIIDIEPTVGSFIFPKGSDIIHALGFSTASMKSIYDVMHSFHGWLAPNLLLILVLLHTGAAIYHHYYKCDDTLVKILPKWLLPPKSRR